MTIDPASPLWTPLTIGPTTVRHRVMVTAHALHYAEDNLLSDRHVAYYEERARGGAALQIAVGHAAHRLTRGTFTITSVAWDKRAIPRFELLADAVHRHDGKVFVQLFANGAQDNGQDRIDDFHELWAPSRVPSPLGGEIPFAMEQAHIDDIVHGFADSARNLELGGIDGAEIHAAHTSSLVGHFLSPVYNRRSDAYGGTARKRCRLALEIAQATRETVGPGFALGIRVTFDEFLGRAGVTAEDTEEQLDELVASGLFDFVNISGGGYATMHMAVAPMPVEDGHLVPFGKRAKAVIGDRAKVFIVGRIRDLELAERVIADGAADMVAMTRAHIADPHLVRKALEGRSEERIRCIGANVCLSRIARTREVVCVMNPVTGRERKWGHGTLGRVEAAGRLRVVVVGGGPAGMKVAAVAGARGHDVLLLERDDGLGGNLRSLARLPTRTGWADAIDNLERALRVSRVEVRLGVEATPELLAAEGAAAVVCATGSHYDRTGFTPLRPDRDAIPGAEAAHVLPVDEAVRRVLADPRSLGAHVVIVDENGTYLPLGLAEVLATAGVTVEVVTRHAIVGEELYFNAEAPHLFPRLATLGVRCTPLHWVESIAAGTVELTEVWGGPRREARADSVVLAMLRTPEDALFEAVRDRYSQVHRIGDALAPRTPLMAIFEGEQLGRAL